MTIPPSPPDPGASVADVAGPDATAEHPAASVIEMRGIGKVYRSGRLEVEALSEVDLDVRSGDFLAVVGPSGSGKSTLMNLLGCLDRPTAGTYKLAGIDVSGLSDDELAKVRNRTIGFVFQSFNLIARTTALENVAMPLLYAGVGRAERTERAREAMARLGLEDRMTHQPSELSGGQQQRVAIARALVTRPTIILADEPTGNLDSASGADVMSLLHELNDAGTTIVLITHDSDVAVAAKRSVHVRDGRVAA